MRSYTRVLTSTSPCRPHWTGLNHFQEFQVGPHKNSSNGFFYTWYCICCHLLVTQWNYLFYTFPVPCPISDDLSWGRVGVMVVKVLTDEQTLIMCTRWKLLDQSETFLDLMRQNFPSNSHFQLQGLPAHKVCDSFCFIFLSI
jgi:hypothetical protein